MSEPLSDAAPEREPSPPAPPPDQRAQRQLLLVQVLCAATTLVAILAFPFVLMAYLSAAASTALVVTVSVIWGGALVAGLLSCLLAWRGWRLAALCCLVGALVVVVIMMQVTALSIGHPGTTFYLYYGMYPLCIMLAGVAAHPRLLVVVAGVVGALSVLVTLSLPAEAFLPTLVVVLLLEAVTTAIMYLFITSYLATMRELTEAQLAFERMKQIDNLKEQFITSVNHELRNPVMAMLGYLDLLRIQRNRASLERLDMIVAEANQAGQDLRALLNSILETRRLDQGIEDFTPQAVNVRDVIEVAVRLIDPREATMQDRELRIRVSPHYHIWGDPIHLQQIFTNLISNAVKYSPPDAPVEVTAAPATDLYAVAGRWGRSETQSRRMLEIMVRDYGLGIPPEQAPLLFQRFARLPRDLASKVVGNGLGLYLCRALAEVMGGKIWIESAGVPGKGSSFFVLLPVPPSEPEPPSVIETSRAELRL